MARETCEKATVTPFIRKRSSGADTAEYTYRRALRITKKPDLSRKFKKFVIPS